MGSFHGVMGGGVVLEFGSREEVRPALGVVGAEDVEVGFNFLVCLFGLSVSLRVIGGGEPDIIFEESGKFPCECRGELRASVGDQCIMKAKLFEDILEKEFPNFHCVDVFLHKE